MSSTDKAWSARFSEPVSELVKRYTASIFFDQRLARHNIKGSLAHAKMLLREDIIPAEDLTAIVEEQERAGSDREFRLTSHTLAFVCHTTFATVVKHSRSASSS